MGNLCGSQLDITVATLNFSGININRFEYHNGSDFFDKLNNNFKTIQKAEMPALTKWKGADLDKNYKQNRFTVLFGNQFIDELRENLFSHAEFSKLWRKYYQLARTEGKFSDYQPTLEGEENVELMDYTFYRALVMTVYNFQSLQDFDEKASKAGVAKLKKKLLEVKQRPAFQLRKKQELLEKYILITDAMFLQEAGSVVWKQLKGYSYVKNKDSLVIYRTQVFGEDIPETSKQWSTELDINNDTAFTFTTKGFLLVSSHFRSAQQESVKQENQLRDVLDKIAKAHKGLKIIVGMDANHYVKQVLLDPKTYIVPNSGRVGTSIKKRTYIQAQLHKADQRINEVKDHIVSTLPITQHWLELVDGNDSQRELLPNDQHPFDHFIVKARLVD